MPEIALAPYLLGFTFSLAAVPLSMLHATGASTLYFAKTDGVYGKERSALHSHYHQHCFLLPGLIHVALSDFL